MATSNTTWDPGRYLRFEQQRAQPFRDLLARIQPEAGAGEEAGGAGEAEAKRAPGTVLDLGCGPGSATALLAERWPDAHILGVDSSPQMIETAQSRYAVPGRLEFRLGDLREVTPDALGGRVDVLITNATLQWVPGHLDLLPSLVDLVGPEGVFALGVPGNFDSPSHTLLADLQREPRWAARLSGLEERPSVHAPEAYLRALSDLGLAAQVWATTYYYVVDGADGVFEFVSSTALRPVLHELGGAHSADAAAFCEDYRALLRAAYPPTDLGGRQVQVLPFRRVFALGVRQLAQA